MTADTAPAPKKSKRRRSIILVSAILGYGVLCAVLTAMRQNANAPAPTPPGQQTEIAATALAHVTTVHTKSYGSTAAAAAARGLVLTFRAANPNPPVTIPVSLGL